MNDLEQRYRHALRWYPRHWRARHGDALLGILLEQAHQEGRTEVSAADRRNLARRGIARRTYPVLLVLLIILGVLAAMTIGSLLNAHVGLDSSLIYMPLLPLYDLSFSGGTLYFCCAEVVAVATVGSVLLIRRLRRA